MKKWYFIILVPILFSACKPKSKTGGEKEINIAMVNWVECIANTHLAKVVLEDRGYKVNLINADVAPVFAAVAKGDADVFMEVWEPITHKPYMDRFGDKIEKLGTIYNDGRLGIVVPQYVQIDSIKELQNQKDKFNGEIIGINPGAGIMKITKKVIEDYGLDLELVTSSEAGMLAALKKAYDKKEWIAVTGWKPHTMFTRYDLKMLVDDKQTMGTSETISVIATKGWSKQNAELAKFFSNFKMDDIMLGSLMLKIEKNPGKEDEAAKEWYAEHKAKIDAWFN
ncbi:glycine betaine ABC transporter substrate-binding protein [Ancylomarina longa]|uniref:Glycine betaine ABC transporter substrate-binding protein n=1 Tax=Ancylomarina longa TaxID=2487017 RepID=A0A434AU81_9BACT|nr:glycine betaine ABC transporter substrate-binding protein [Ancylomarina longa]RUT77895.1 glycine betaine ABC transporter substrate-binding protein [Ancylomarina longa]